MRLNQFAAKHVRDVERGSLVMFGFRGQTVLGMILATTDPEELPTKPFLVLSGEFAAERGPCIVDTGQVVTCLDLGSNFYVRPSLSETSVAFGSDVMTRSPGTLLLSGTDVYLYASSINDRLRGDGQRLVNLMTGACELQAPSRHSVEFKNWSLHLGTGEDRYDLGTWPLPLMKTAEVWAKL